MIKTKKELLIDERVKILQTTHVFSDTDVEVLRDIAKALKEKHARNEKVILKKGDIGNAMFIIVKGRVRVHDGNHVLSKLGSGSIFGEYSLIDEETRSASVTAEESCDLLKLSQEDFFNIIFEKKEITKGVLRVLINRMRSMNELEEKLSKSYKEIQKQKEEIELQHINISEQKDLLEEQNYDLLSLNEEKNHLISILVHGMKNPLTSSICMIDVLKSNEDQLNSDQKEFVGIIDNSLQRMNSMINQILNVNRIESKTFSLKLETIELSKLIKNVLANFKVVISRKKLTINLNLNESYAKLNEVYTYQIIDNLLSNAVRFSSESKCIKIDLQQTEEKVRIEISDEGPGIESNRIDTIFDQYQRQTKVHTLETSNGLGLAIVKKYVTAMKGKVWCESELSKGAKFIIEFLAMNPN
ncbi:MAG: cyclic nucleotide-binding domain-containing protein [Bacteroidetes bacterium]|nr:cyclic nucleotide-binding domain-containing protein [Bacteroidota bacterium]